MIMANRFLNEKTLASTDELLVIAKEAGMSPVTLGIAWSKQHDFVASAIIGANTVEQLEDSLKAADLELNAEILKKIDAVSKKIMYPMG
jgi:aryl-alcohol dehydrogenase-like predicted oxidoreductase